MFAITLLFVVVPLMIILAFAKRAKYTKMWNKGKCKNGGKLKVERTIFGKNAHDMKCVCKCECCKEEIIVPMLYTLDR